MFTINENYLKLQGSYLFSTVAKKVAAYKSMHPDKTVISLGIGDVTLPLAPAIIEALQKAVAEMGTKEGFHGYAPERGYDFLLNAIAKEDFAARGCEISPDEIFVSDGAKCDVGNIQEIFGTDNLVAVCDPVYPVYVDTNVMAGRTGVYDKALGTYEGLVYMPCTQENGFAPKLPDKTPDLIYLCFPNNPTGAAITKEALQKALSEDVVDTYNMISVDGDTSTNDTALVLANGMAENPVIEYGTEAYQTFKAALHEINEYLAKQIAGDGEGATALFEVKVKGAESVEAAKVLAKSIACSNLTKTAIAGHDANWGRIVCAMGYSGAQFDPEKVDLFFESKAGKIQIAEDGVALDFSEEKATEILSQPEVTAIADVKMGDAEATAWGCDLTHGYIEINADYRS